MPCMGPSTDHCPRRAKEILAELKSLLHLKYWVPEQFSIIDQKEVDAEYAKIEKALERIFVLDAYEGF